MTNNLEFIQKDFQIPIDSFFKKEFKVQYNLKKVYNKKIFLADNFKDVIWTDKSVDRLLRKDYTVYQASIFYDTLLTQDDIYKVLIKTFDFFYLFSHLKINQFFKVKSFNENGIWELRFSFYFVDLEK